MNQQKQPQRDNSVTDKSRQQQQQGDSPSVRREQGGQASQKGSSGGREARTQDADLGRNSQERSGQRAATRRTSEYSDDV
jgi:hypothetical protein